MFISKLQLTPKFLQGKEQRNCSVKIQQHDSEVIYTAGETNLLQLGNYGNLVLWEFE